MHLFFIPIKPVLKHVPAFSPQHSNAVFYCDNISLQQMAPEDACIICIYTSQSINLTKKVFNYFSRVYKINI